MYGRNRKCPKNGGVQLLVVGTAALYFAKTLQNALSITLFATFGRNEG